MGHNLLDRGVIFHQILNIAGISAFYPVFVMVVMSDGDEISYRYDTQLGMEIQFVWMV